MRSLKFLKVIISVPTNKLLIMITSVPTNKLSFMHYINSRQLGNMFSLTVSLRVAYYLLTTVHRLLMCVCVKLGGGGKIPTTFILVMYGWQRSYSAVCIAYFSHGGFLPRSHKHLKRYGRLMNIDDDDDGYIVLVACVSGNSDCVV